MRDEFWKKMLTDDQLKVRIDSGHGGIVGIDPKADDPKAVVLIGDVGAGKSSLVEKVIGTEMFSSDAPKNFTEVSRAFRTPCQRLLLIDTPGSNAMRENLQHNVCKVNALLFRPVSLVLLVVKAEVRIGITLDHVRKYMELFVEFGDHLGVMITHMDTTTGWDLKEAAALIKDELDIESVAGFGKDDRSTDVSNEIFKFCRPAPVDFGENQDRLWQLFPVGDKNVKISKCMKDEIKSFKKLVELEVQKLDQAPSEQAPKERCKVVQQLRGKMEETIEKVISRCGLNSGGANQPLERGYIADLSRELQQILEDSILGDSDGLPTDDKPISYIMVGWLPYKEAIISSILSNVPNFGPCFGPRSPAKKSTPEKSRSRSPAKESIPEKSTTDHSNWFF